jgi:hypothetical protein
MPSRAIPYADRSLEALRGTNPTAEWVLPAMPDNP